MTATAQKCTQICPLLRLRRARTHLKKKSLPEKILQNIKNKKRSGGGAGPVDRHPPLKLTYFVYFSVRDTRRPKPKSSRSPGATLTENVSRFVYSSWRGSKTIIGEDDYSALLCCKLFFLTCQGRRVLPDSGTGSYAFFEMAKCARGSPPVSQSLFLSLMRAYIRTEKLCLVHILSLSLSLREKGERK